MLGPPNARLRLFAADVAPRSFRRLANTPLRERRCAARKEWNVFGTELTDQMILNDVRDAMERFSEDPR